VIKINNRIAVVLASFLIIMSAIGLMMYPNQSQGLQFSSSVMPDSSITIQGHVLPDGDLALFYFSSPTGPNIIHSKTVVPVNQISLDLYSLQAQNLSIAVAQFSGFYTHNVTTRIGNNTTIITPAKSMIEPEYDNTTIKTQYRELETFTITLPETSIQRDVSITIDNATFYFLHKTSPDIFPVFLTGLGQLGIALGYLLMGVIIFFLGTLTSDLLLRKMRYWPPFGKLGWTMILFILGIAMGMIILSDYYQLAYIQWYYWLLPFYIFSTLAMLEIWPQQWEKWFLLITGDGKNREWDAEFPRMAKIHDGYEYLRPGRKEALKRLLFHIPVKFSIQGKIEGVELSKNDERISQFFIAKDYPFYEYEIQTEKNEEKKHKIHIPHRKKIRDYLIPISMHHSKPMADFFSGLRAVHDFAVENEKLGSENMNQKILIKKLGIRANRQLIDRITGLLDQGKFSPDFVEEYHDEVKKLNEGEKDGKDGKEE